VGEEKVEAPTVLAEKGVAQGADSRAGVDDQDVVVRASDLQSGGVAAVAVEIGARNGNRPPGSPTGDAHGVPYRCGSGAG
jgi:hypothetical protein